MPLIPWKVRAWILELHLHSSFSGSLSYPLGHRMQASVCWVPLPQRFPSSLSQRIFPLPLLFESSYASSDQIRFSLTSLHRSSSFFKNSWLLKGPQLLLDIVVPIFSRLEDCLCPPSALPPGVSSLWFIHVSNHQIIGEHPPCMTLYIYCGWWIEWL